MVNDRICGECRLCCELVPVEEILKRAGQRCEHQVDTPGGGCGVYKNRPLSCRWYYCGWLAMNETRGLARPDESHYVIHPEPDVVRMTIDAQNVRTIKVMVIWVDPKYPQAYKDPKLLYLLDKNKIVVKLAYNSVESTLLVPPSMNDSGTWQERKIEVDWDSPMAKEAVRLGLAERPT